MILPICLLILCLGSLVWFTRRDLADYRAFKRLTETRDRQRRFRVWVVKSFLLFFCGAVAALAILGRLHALVAMPVEFLQLSSAIQSRVDIHETSAFFSGFAVAAAGSFVAGILASVVMKRRGKARAKTFQIGDVQALLPRNGREMLWTALLSVNAGLSEEVYFRLLLPLLLATIIGNALTAFAIAAVIFGLVHFYQGAAGVLATTLVGVLLTALYLWTGSIWIAAMVHALMDLMSLVVRPWLTRIASRQTEASTLP
jgi:membrane protease YdiL (CAAX protease family)